MFLLVAIPSYDSMPVQFVECLLKFKDRLIDAKINFHISIKTGAFLPHTRAASLGADLKRGQTQIPFNSPSITHALLIDSDIIFKFDDFINLLRHDASVVAGAYPYATEAGVEEDRKQIVAGHWDEEKFKEKYFFPPLTIGEAKKQALLSDEGLAEVSWVGLGFTLVKTDIFSKISYPWFESERISIDNLIDTTSEDVGFCRKLTRAGVPIYLDPFVRVGHYKSNAI